MDREIVVTEDLVQLARGAGDVLLPYYGRLSRIDAQRKGGRHRDLVSEADLAAERYILEAIPAADNVLSEESGSRQSDAHRCWVVDPLDGTINFLHSIPFWCVSIAYFEHDVLRCAVVHAPALAMTFTASRGGGCQLNGRSAKVSSVTAVRDAVLATGFPYARDTVADNNLDNVPRVGKVAGGLRRFGSAALDLAFTACGRLDGMWELHLEPWDIAAGLLLVQEAGGRVGDFRGATEVSALLTCRNLIASNGHIHDELRALLAPLREV